MYQKYFKRVFDLSLSLFLIIVLSPAMLCIFLLIWFKIGFPIYFQKRPGLNNKIFTIYKFKTLYDEPVWDSRKRQSSFGNFLRKTGIDEMPQLFNILENSMSFVGPRPLISEYLKMEEFKNHARSKCKPGITGLSQISAYTTEYNFNDKSKWSNQFSLDKHYYENLNFFLDIKIIFLTFYRTTKTFKNDHYKEPAPKKSDLK